MRYGELPASVTHLYSRVVTHATGTEAPTLESSRYCPRYPCIWQFIYIPHILFYIN